MAGIIQGLIFGFFLLSKKRCLLANFYLAITVLCLSLNNLEYWFSDSGLSKIYPALGYLYIPFELLIIPSFFLFVNLYLDLKNSKKNRNLLIAPFISSSAIHFLIALDSLFFNDTQIALNVRRSYFILEEYFSFSFSLLLIIIIIKKICTYRQNNKNYNSGKVIAKTKWLNKILFIGLILCFGWVFVIYFMAEDHTFGFMLYYPLWISISVLIYWISYASANNYTILLERTTLRKQINNIAPIKNRPPVPDNQYILLKFELLIRESYSNPMLNIDLVAEKLEISGNYLSQIISKHNIKFNNYVNNYRIENSKKMLTDENFSKYTITSIGLEAGFNSKASFYRAFKKHTGQTPIEFKEQKN